MPDLWPTVMIGVTAFAGGVVCGTAVVGPKLFSAVTAILGQMSHDLNPRRDATLD